MSWIVIFQITKDLTEHPFSYHFDLDIRLGILTDNFQLSLKENN